MSDCVSCLDALDNEERFHHEQARWLNLELNLPALTLASLLLGNLIQHIDTLLL